MASVLNIPDRAAAESKVVPIPCSTGKGDDKKESTFDAELPRNLASAIALYGEDEVFGRFLNAYVVFLQGKERNKLSGEKKERKRAPYLEQLGR